MLKQVKATKLRIAILGWGSLIWDTRPAFDDYHKDWQLDGPTLPLEFSRISESRKDALTLVIDTLDGSNCQVAYAVSTRRCPEDSIADLRCREGTIIKRIGFYFADDSKRCQPDVPKAIKSWAHNNNFDVVVWTGLLSNFKDITNDDFSVERAITYIQNLPTEGKAMAATYVWNAPCFIQTRLRKALQGEPWFAVDPANRKDAIT